MRKYFFIPCLIIVFSLLHACSKQPDTNGVASNMLVGGGHKTWNLSYYLINGLRQTSNAGLVSYSLTFGSDGSYQNSDGLLGKWTMNTVNGKTKITVTFDNPAGAQSGLQLIYDVASIGSELLILSFSFDNQLLTLHLKAP